MDFPPITLLPKQTISCWFGGEPPGQGAGLRAGFSASAGEQPAFGTHAWGQQTKAAPCPSSQGPPRPHCPSWPADPVPARSNLLQEQQSPKETSAKRGSTRQPHAQASPWSLTLWQAAAATSRACDCCPSSPSALDYPQQGTRDTSCPGTTGPSKP